VLDEPTAALDAYGEQAVFRNAHTLARTAGAQRGGLTVLVTHRAASASITDHLITNKPTGPYATRYHLEAAGYTPGDDRPTGADQEER